ncbi:putative cytosol aminopeptidase [Gorgonomyces haynaldii]|nr:putative cytosol aminopeptidase [Gorgonomyces haynaldii]
MKRVLVRISQQPVLNKSGIQIRETNDTIDVAVDALTKQHTMERTSKGLSQILQYHDHVQVQVSGFKHDQHLGIGLFSCVPAEYYKKVPKLEMQLDQSLSNPQFQLGMVQALSHLMARKIKETPANHMTPSMFCDLAQKILKGTQVSVKVRELDWIRQKMPGLYHVSKGSAQPPRFLELVYGDTPEYVLVGKGVTFDSGGISLKKADDMARMKGDLGGAAVCLSTLDAIQKLDLKINVAVLIPLTENLIGPESYKPGDVVVASNGESIEIDNTDAEGRVILSDALYYATTEYQPKRVIELSTLTGSIGVALGSCYSGVFTNDDQLWLDLEQAGKQVGDEFWRMPLSDKYEAQITGTITDWVNVGRGKAGACTAAWFLSRFLNKDWKGTFCHIDIAGVMSDKDLGMSQKGMTGRPTRALIEYFASRSA